MKSSKSSIIYGFYIIFQKINKNIIKDMKNSRAFRALGIYHEI